MPFSISFICVSLCLYVRYRHVFCFTYISYGCSSIFSYRVLTELLWYFSFFTKSNWWINFYGNVSIGCHYSRVGGKIQLQRLDFQTETVWSWNSSASLVLVFLKQNQSLFFFSVFRYFPYRYWQSILWGNRLDSWRSVLQKICCISIPSFS